MKYIITEQEKEDILNKYQDNTDDKIMIYLRRNYIIVPPTGEYFTSNRVLVDDKLYEIEGKKQYLVNKIFYEIEDEFVGYDKRIIRRTIKKYLDLIKLI